MIYCLGRFESLGGVGVVRRNSCLSFCLVRFFLGLGIFGVFYMERGLSGGGGNVVRRDGSILNGEY